MLISEIIGHFGRYHYWLCFIIFLSRFGIGLHQMAIIFLAPPIKHQCPGNNETCCENPIYDTSLFTRTIVTEWHLICGRTWLKDFTQTIFQLGVLLGSVILGIASDKFGRKPILIISVILEVLTGVMASFIPNYWAFNFVRMILGFSVGGIMVVTFVIIMEFVGTTKRNLISALFHIPFTMGCIALSLFGYLLRDYKHFQLAISAINILLLAYICVLPETPRWLLAVNRTQEAIALMERVALYNNLPRDEIRQKIEAYQLEHKSRNVKKGSVIDLFRSPNMRRNILVMSFTWLVCSYCFYGVSYYISHLKGNIFLHVVASGSVSFLACFFAIPVIKYMKRKSTVIIGNVLCSLCFIIIAFVPEGKASVVLGCFGVLFCYMIFIVIYLYCTEMFPTVVRNAAVGISSMMARFGAMIAPFIAELKPYGKWCAPVAFSIFPLIAALLCLLLPETKDCELLMTIEEGEALGTRVAQSQQPQIRNQTSRKEDGKT